MKLDNVWHKSFYASFFVLAAATFTSLSISALSHILLGVALLAFWLDQKGSGKAFELPKSAWAMVALTGAIILSVAFADNPKPWGNIKKVKYFILIAFAVPLIVEYAKTKLTVKSARLLIHIFLIATSLASISGVIGAFTGFNPLRMKAACHEYRACGMYGMYMSYGYGIHFVAVLLAGLVVLRKETEKYVDLKVLIFAVVANFVGLYFAYARGALLSFMICAPLYLMYKNKKLVIFAFVGLIVASGVLIGTSKKVQSLFTTERRVDSILIRWTLFQSAFYAFEEHPITGIGYRNLEPNVVDIKAKHDLDFPKFAGHAHNNFIEHLATTGILGFLALLAFHILWAKELLWRRDVLGKIFLPILLAVFISGQFQYTLGDGENLFLLMGFYLISQIKKVGTDG